MHVSSYYFQSQSYDCHENTFENVNQLFEGLEVVIVLFDSTLCYFTFYLAIKAIEITSL